MRTVKKPEVRRQEIVAAATELFLSREYEKTTMNDVMKALDIAKGTIYHYFPSKEKLLEAVVEHLAEGYVELRKSNIKSTPGSALVKIQTLFSNDHQSETEQEAIEHLHKQGNVKLHTRLLAVLVGKLAPVFGGLIEQGCEEGLFETEHPQEVAELLIAGIQFLTDDGVFPWKEDVIHRRMKAFPPIIEVLLKAEAGSFSFLFESATTKSSR